MKGTSGVLLSNGVFLPYALDEFVKITTMRKYNNGEKVFVGKMTDLGDDGISIDHEEYGQLSWNLEELEDIQLV